MDAPRKTPHKLRLIIEVVVGIAAISSVAAITYGYLRIQALSTTVQNLTSELSSTTIALSNNLASLDARATGLGSSLATTEQDLQATKSNVDAVRTQVGGVTDTVSNMSGTVTNLEKLTKTDPELLQKYSKVFFLNEHYAPERVTEIDTLYLYSENKPEVIHAQVWPHLKNMLDVAGASHVNLYVKSAYRSFDEQKSLNSAYSVTYGAGTAHTFSADQGYSEHQLGTAVDFITGGLAGQLDGFDRTAAYTWMRGNAHHYGFILSYPQGNKYYVYEPWHWRYVGVKLATYLHDNNKHFYDLDQREIDGYLVNIFD